MWRTLIGKVRRSGVHGHRCQPARSKSLNGEPKRRKFGKHLVTEQRFFVRTTLEHDISVEVFILLRSGLSSKIHQGLDRAIWWGFVAELTNNEEKLGRVSVGYGTEYGFLEEALRL